MSKSPPILRIGNGDTATVYVEDPKRPGRMIAVKHEPPIGDQIQELRVRFRHLTNEAHAIALRLGQLEHDVAEANR